MSIKPSSSRGICTQMTTRSQSHSSQDTSSQKILKPKKKKAKQAPSQDSSEEKFCHCDQPAEDLMIKCDKTSCKIKWFHFKCIGLSSVPDGSWFCPFCTSS